MTNSPAPDRKISCLGGVAIFVVVFLLWLLTPVVIEYFYPDLSERGQVGDLFGSINALFSGLAFAGVIVAILLQREELALQRQALARAATAQGASYEALQKTIYAQAFKSVVDILQADAVREARRVVLSELCNKPFDAGWTPAELRAAETVCQTYDQVGIMVQHGLLPVHYIVDSWGDSLRRTWKIVKPLVDKYRKERKSNEYWNDYQYLAAEAECFKTNNPSTSVATGE